MHRIARTAVLAIVIAAMAVPAAGAAGTGGLSGGKVSRNDLSFTSQQQDGFRGGVHVAAGDVNER